jgi:hypothetical protein
MTKSDPNQGALVLPPTRDGRTPSGMKTALSGAGNRITKVHELGERVFLFVEANVKKSGHEVTDDGVLYTEALKVLDLFELDDAPGKRLLAALRQAYRSAAGEDPLTLGDETAGEGLEVAVDAAGVAITPTELAALREDPSTALDDERFDHVVLVFSDGSRGLWPDDWAGTGQSRAPIGGTMRRPGSTKAGDTAQVVELLDATTGETLDKWTPERENERLLALEHAAETDEAREAELEEFELLRTKADGDELTDEETVRFEELRDRFEAEARADRQTMEDLGLAGDPPEANEDLVQPGEPDPDGPFEGDRPDDELEVETAPVVAYGPDDCLAVDRDVSDLKAWLKETSDRETVLRWLAAEEDGRGRGLKPRKGALDALEKRAGELFVSVDDGAPELSDDLDVPDDADLEPTGEEF